MAGGSPFAMGDSIQLWLTYLSLLVACVVVLEQVLHKLRHKLERYPKYEEMLNKTFGELMILGLVGLVLKVYKEATHANPSSRALVAFQAADLTIFILAMALILQAICVFVLLRRTNVQVDKAELISSAHLLDAINTNAASGAQASLRFPLLTRARNTAGATSNRATRISASDYPELLRMRLLRHFFLRTYGLPELFPFSKYLRQAQDNQITHMIDVEMSTWIVLLAIAWGIEGLSELGKRIPNVEERRVVVYVYMLFSWLSVLLHVAVLAYLRWAVEQLLSVAGERYGRSTQLACLRAVVADEAQSVNEESVSDAIATMECVREREKKTARRRMRFTRHDTGFQLIATIYRNICAKCCSSKSRKDASEDAHLDAETGAEPNATAAPRAALELRWFSRKAWHFVVMALLMLNGFYVALFLQVVLREFIADYEDFDPLFVVLAPVPCLVNVMFFQSRILRHFVLVSSIVRVDDTALTDVIDHFTETVRLRAEFVATVTAFMDASGLTVADLDAELRAKDADATGLLEVEDVRRVLQRFGFTLSYFRFNSVAKLLFELRGTQLAYAQVAALLTFAQQHDTVRRLYNDTKQLDTSGADSASESALRSDASLQHSTASRPATLVRRESASAARSLYQLDFTLLDTQVLQTSTGGTTTASTATHVRL